MRATRFRELYYDRFGSDWRFVDSSTDNAVGPYYPTRFELLADAERYAREFGCEGASPSDPCNGAHDWYERVGPNDETYVNCNRCGDSTLED